MDALKALRTYVCSYRKLFETYWKPKCHLDVEFHQHNAFCARRILYIFHVFCAQMVEFLSRFHSEMYDGL